MKYTSITRAMVSSTSLPMRGEWIEISGGFVFSPEASWSLPMRGEWIEICCITDGKAMRLQSLPMRGEWIEIRSRWWTAADAASLPMRGEWIEMRRLVSLLRDW